MGYCEVQNQRRKMFKYSSDQRKTKFKFGFSPKQALNVVHF